MNAELTTKDGKKAVEITTNSQVRQVINNFKAIKTAGKSRRQINLVPSAGGLSTDQLEEQLKNEIQTKLFVQGQANRTRAQRMVHVPIRGS